MQLCAAISRLPTRDYMLIIAKFSSIRQSNYSKSASTSSASGNNHLNWFLALLLQLGHHVTFPRRFDILNQGEERHQSATRSKNPLASALYVTTTSYVQWLRTIMLGNPILPSLARLPLQRENLQHRLESHSRAQEEFRSLRVEMMAQ